MRKMPLGEDENAAQSPHEKLSDREYQVLCMVASGKSVSEIAKELFLSVKTISTYRSRILQKMKMKSNPQMTHYAIQHRLIK
jgi:two-component system, NarL family, invasion response regulator UvrY